jgi:hypothetical protein
VFTGIKVLQRINFKTLKTFFGVLLVVCFAGPIILYYHHRASNVENHREDISDYRHPRPRHEIRGFRFDSNHDGKRVISIKVFIHLYGRGGSAEDKSDDWQDLTFKDVFSREILPSFPIKRISSIVMEPVCVKLHDEQFVVTQISASSASIRLKKRDILFKGNVRVVSGSRVLTTDQLRMLPEEGVIKTDRHFILKTPEKQWEGARLTTDVFLRPCIDGLVKSQKSSHSRRGIFDFLRIHQYCVSTKYIFRIKEKKKIKGGYD